MTRAKKIGVRHLFSEEELGDELEFPGLGKGPVPTDLAALRRLAAGERALGTFYAAWSEEARGDGRCIARMLLCDWKRTLEDSSKALEGLLASLGHAEKSSPQPSTEKVKALAAKLAAQGAAEASKGAAAFAHRSLGARTLVPWRSDVPEVFEQFKTTLEAEDSHLWVADLLATLGEGA